MKNKNTIIETPKTFYVKPYNDHFAAKHPTHEPWVGKRMALEPATESNLSSDGEESAAPASESAHASNAAARPPPVEHNCCYRSRLHGARQSCIVSSSYLNSSFESAQNLRRRVERQQPFGRV